MLNLVPFLYRRPGIRRTSLIGMLVAAVGYLPPVTGGSPGRLSPCWRRSTPSAWRSHWKPFEL
jgi:hypothetical protein